MGGRVAILLAVGTPLMRPSLYVILFAIKALGSVSADAEPIRCQGHSSAVTAVALAPEGTLAVSCDKSLVHVWNTSDGSEVRKLQVFSSESPGDSISDALFSPDGRSIAVAASRQPITFWDVKTWTRMAKSLPVGDIANGLAFSPDGAKLAVAENAAVSIWDLASYKLAREFRFNGVQIGRASRVAFSKDGLILAAALHDYGASFEPREPKVRAWNALTGDVVFTGWNLKSASAVAVSPDVSLLAAASGDTVEIWSIRTHDSLLQLHDAKVVLCIAFSPDGTMIATGGNDSVIKLWNTTTGKNIGSLKGHANQVHDLCYSTDGKTLASAGSDKEVLIWNLATDMTQK
jgi:WD40 repeat protein